MRILFSTAALLLLFASPATAGTETQYVWYGWRMTATDYVIVHALPKDPTENDFYLICYGGRDQVKLSIRGLNSGGYALEEDKNLPTTFVFGKKKIPFEAWTRGPAEMLGGINIDYMIDRDDPVFVAIAHGEPFRIVLPKATTQLFVPKPAVRVFREMAAHCKAAP